MSLADDHDDPGPAALPDGVAPDASPDALAVDVDDGRVVAAYVTLDGPTAGALGRALFWMVEDDTGQVHLSFDADEVKVRVGRTLVTVDRRRSG